MNYLSLTHAQRARVEYLFADDVFGTDPTSYEYEVNARGEVTGRTRISRSGREETMSKRQPSAVITVRAEETITEEALSNQIQFMKSLASRIIQSQYMEA